MAGFSVQRLERGDGSTVFQLRGELDLGAEEDYRDEVTGVADGGVAVLDLSGLSFMDSTGLRLVLETDAEVRARGGRCIVVRGGGAVHRVIAQSLLESRLEVVDQIDQIA